MTSAPLRVLVTLDAVGGVWQYGLDLARGLATRGAQTVLAVMGPAPDAAQRDEARGLAGATVVETGLPLDWLCDGPAPMVRAAAEIAAMARDLKVDAVQYNMPTLAAGADPGVPVIAVTHGCVGTWWQAARAGQPLAPEYLWHRDMTAQGLRRADRVVAPSAGYARTITQYYQLPTSPLVVHNGRSPLAAAAQGSPAHEVLTVGRLWDQVKRADLLDRAAALLDAPFHAAGAATGPHGERAQLHHLKLLGQLDGAQLAARLARQPVFVSAAAFEPFGLSVLEAAQAGCALVLSDIDTFRELWDGAACFVAHDDPAAWAAAIAGMLGDDAGRRTMGEAARARAARYTPQATADAMLAIYADALRNHDHGRAAA